MDESETTTTGQTSILFPHNHEEKMRRTIAARALVEEDNFHPRDSVTVRVPATSANMGPGCTFFWSRWTCVDSVCVCVCANKPYVCVCFHAGFLMHLDDISPF